MNGKHCFGAAAVAAWTIGLCGCGYTPGPPKDPYDGPQTYKDAVAAFCDVDRRAGLDANGDPFELGQKRTEWIRANVENPDGIYLRTAISVKGPVEQGKDLRTEAKEQGITSCALADDLEKTGLGGIAP